MWNSKRACLFTMLTEPSIFVFAIGAANFAKRFGIASIIAIIAPRKELLLLVFDSHLVPTLRVGRLGNKFSQSLLFLIFHCQNAILSM